MQPPGRHVSVSDQDLIRAARGRVCPDGLSQQVRARRAIRSLPGYELIQMLHRGGQGVVYHAIQVSTGREVAIKLLRHGLASTGEELTRQWREVQVLGQLRHPAIVTIHDSGADEGLSYFVMNYIDGRPLDAYVAGADLSRNELVDLFARIAEAVEAAHLHGVIHRDLKPANILVDADGGPHVVDFGLAKLEGDANRFATMTHTGLFVGSLPWSAPEQARGDHRLVDLRTDVYALGVVFWHALTGSFPYDVGGDMPTALRNIIEAEPTAISGTRIRPGRDLETIVRRCLAKAPERRYQNAGELAADLRRLRAGKPIAARRDSTAYVVWRTVTRHKLAFGLLTAIFVLAVGSAIGLGVLLAQANRSAAALRESLYRSSIDLAVRAFAEGNAGELRAALDRAPADRRRWEWHFLHRQADTSRLFIPRPASTVTWSPDGRRLAVQFSDSGLSLVDAKTGALVRTYDSGEIIGGYPRAAFSSDGRRIAIGGIDDTDCRLWDVETGALLLEIPNDRRDAHPTTRLQFSMDGQRIYARGRFTDFRIYDANTGALIATTSSASSQGGLDSVETFKDVVVVASANRLELLDPFDLRVLSAFELSGTLSHHIVSGDGSAVIVGYQDGRIFRLPLPEMRTAQLLASLDSGVQLAAAPHSALAVELRDSGQLLLLDAANGRQIRRLIGHSASVYWKEFSPDGSQLASAGADGLRIWDLTRTPWLFQAGSAITALAVSSSGRWIATSGLARVVRVHDAQTREQLFQSPSANARNYGLAFSPDSGMLVFNDERARKLVFVGTRDWQPIPIEIPCGNPCWGIDWSANGDLLAVGQPGRQLSTQLSNETPKAVEVWSVSRREHVFAIPGYATAKFSPDGRYLLAYNTAPFGGVNRGGPEIQLWQVEPPRFVRSFGDGTNEVDALAWSSDSRWFAAGYFDTVIRLWNVDGNALGELQGHQGVVKKVAISPDGFRLASGSADGTVRIWDVPGQRTVLTLTDHEGCVDGVEFSPDGHILYSCAVDGKLSLRDGRPLDAD